MLFILSCTGLHVVHAVHVRGCMLFILYMYGAVCCSYTVHVRGCMLFILYMYGAVCCSYTVHVRGCMLFTLYMYGLYALHDVHNIHLGSLYCTSVGCSDNFTVDVWSESTSRYLTLNVS